MCPGASTTISLGSPRIERLVAHGLGAELDVVCPAGLRWPPARRPPGGSTACDLGRPIADPARGEPLCRLTADSSSLPACSSHCGRSIAASSRFRNRTPSTTHKRCADTPPIRRRSGGSADSEQPSGRRNAGARSGHYRRIAGLRHSRPARSARCTPTRHTPDPSHIRHPIDTAAAYPCPA